ncbi:MAG TPA: dynamin family protein [Planctomycetota bacterium]|nr:dynamin family protein [Planctomycetota bacterium]
MAANGNETQVRDDSIRWVGLLRDLLRQCGDFTAVRLLDRAHKLFQDGRVYLAIAGKAKCGRSSLINALLGRRDDAVAPTSKLYSTNVVSGFGRDENESATIIFENGGRAHCMFERIREFVTDEQNTHNVKEVSYVEVYGAFDGLDPDLVLVDTPGVGSSDAEAEGRTLDFIPHADAVLLLAATRMPLNRDDAILVKRIQESNVRKLFVAINKADQATERDLSEAVAHNRAALKYAGVNADVIRCISACRALWGEFDAGLCALQGDIAAFMKAQKKKIVAARLVTQALCVVEQAGVELSAKYPSSDDPRTAKLKQFEAALRGLLAEMKA